MRAGSSDARNTQKIRNFRINFKCIHGTFILVSGAPKNLCGAVCLVSSNVRTTSRNTIKLKTTQWRNGNIKLSLSRYADTTDQVCTFRHGVPQNAPRSGNELGTKSIMVTSLTSALRLRNEELKPRETTSLRATFRLYSLRIPRNESRTIPDEQFSNSATKPGTAPSSFRINPTSDAPSYASPASARFGNGFKLKLQTPQAGCMIQ